MHDVADPYPFFAGLRASSPISQVGDSPYYWVSTFSLIEEALSRPEDFSANLTATMVWNTDGTISETPIAALGAPFHVLATADDPLHRLHRSVAMPSVSAKRLQRMRPVIDTALDTLWKNGLDDGRIDWVTAIAQRLPMTVVAQMVGLPSPDLDDLLRFSFASTALLDGVVSREQLTAASKAAGELIEYLSQAFAEAYKDPRDNSLGDLVRAVEAGKIDATTAITILVQLVIAGAESTVSLIGSTIWLLGTRPDLQKHLRMEPGSRTEFIEETLRLESPFRGHYRHVTRDTELGEVSLTEGSRLYLSWASANRDEAVFEAPEEIRLGPKARRPHIAFGYGPHRCVGAGLARIEASAALTFLLDNTQWVEVDSTDPQWEPSLLVRRLASLPIAVR